MYVYIHKTLCTLTTNELGTRIVLGCVCTRTSMYALCTAETGFKCMHLSQKQQETTYLNSNTKLMTTPTRRIGLYTLVHMAVAGKIKQLRRSERHATKWQPSTVMMSTGVNPSDISYFLRQSQSLLHPQNWSAPIS